MEFLIVYIVQISVINVMDKKHIVYHAMEQIELYGQKLISIVCK